MSDKLMDTKLIDEKRQKRLDACKKYYEFKKNDAEYQRKLKEGERQRYELRKQNPEWVANNMNMTAKNESKIKKYSIYIIKRTLKSLMSGAGDIIKINV